MRGDDEPIPPIPFPLARSPVVTPANDRTPAPLVLAPPTGTRRHARSRQHKLGDENERLVAILNQNCRTLGVADVSKVPEPWKVIGPPSVGPKVGRYWPAVPMAASECASGVDYKGVMLDGSGRGVAVEAKRCADGRFDLVRDVTPGQLRELNTYVVAGAVAVLLVIYGPDRRVYPLPWAAVCTVRAAHDSSFPEKTIRPDALARAVPLGEPYLAAFRRPR